MKEYRVIRATDDIKKGEKITSREKNGIYTDNNMISSYDIAMSSPKRQV